VFGIDPRPLPGGEKQFRCAGLAGCTAIRAGLLTTPAPRLAFDHVTASFGVLTMRTRVNVRRRLVVTHPGEISDGADASPEKTLAPGRLVVET
jgi:hypothetical protein